MNRLSTWIGPIILLLVALAVAGYWFYWDHLAAELRAGFDRWVEQRRAEGLTVQHGAVDVGGFPYRLTLTVADPALGAPQEKLAPAWSAPQLTIYFQPWNLRHVIAEAGGRQHLAWTDGGTRHEAFVTAETAQASSRFDRSGRLDEFAADYRNVKVTGPLPLEAAARLQLHGRVNHGEAPERPAGSLDLALEAEKATLGQAIEPLGREIDAAFLTLLARPMPAATTPAALDAWRDAGGVIDVHRLLLRTGELEVSGDGSFALDRERRPEAAMSLDVHNAEAFLDALVANGSLSGAGRLGLGVAVNALERPDAAGKPIVRLPVTVQDGRLAVAGFELLAVRPLY